MVYIVTTAGCVWNHEGLSGVGWLAVALVIFCMWHPLSAIWGSIFFGALMILYLRLIIPFIPDPALQDPAVSSSRCIVLVISSSLRNNKRKAATRLAGPAIFPRGSLNIKQGRCRPAASLFISPPQRLASPERGGGTAQP